MASRLAKLCYFLFRMLWYQKTMLTLFGVIGYSLLMGLIMDGYRGMTLPASYNVQSPTTLPNLRNATSKNSTTKHPQLITLFTTFKHYEGKGVTYRNTIRNWALLAPFVRPVLYYPFGEDYLTEFARTNGWSVYKCPRSSKYGVPVLRSMFLHAQEINDTTSFYGYANGDILFSNNLVATLKALRTDNATFNQLLVVGRRTNYNFKENEEIYNLDPVYRYATAGKLFTTDAQDFFISTHSGFPWDSIPDFVVGRVGYDNWLVATAVNRNYSVVDVTATVTALHQTGVDGNHAGHRKRKGDDMSVNHRLAGRFDYSNGVTTCANLMTRWRKDRVVTIKQPDMLRKRCVRNKKMYSMSAKMKASILAATRVRATAQRKTFPNMKLVYSSKYSRFIWTISEGTDSQGRTTKSSRDMPVMSNPTSVTSPTPTVADVQRTTKSSRDMPVMSNPTSVTSPTPTVAGVQRTTKSSRDIDRRLPVTSNATRVTSSTPTVAGIQSPMPISRQAQLPTSKHTQMPLPTTFPLVKQANISLSPT